MKYRVKFTTAYKKGYKRAKKRGLNMDLLDEVVDVLRNGEKLDAKYHMHYTEILKAFGNVIFSRIGCWFILSRTIF